MYKIKYAIAYLIVFYLPYWIKYGRYTIAWKIKHHYNPKAYVTFERRFVTWAWFILTNKRETI